MNELNLILCDEWVGGWSASYRGGICTKLIFRTYLDSLRCICLVSATLSVVSLLVTRHKKIKRKKSFALDTILWIFENCQVAYQIIPNAFPCQALRTVGNRQYVYCWYQISPEEVRRCSWMGCHLTQPEPRGCSQKLLFFYAISFLVSISKIILFNCNLIIFTNTFIMFDFLFVLFHLSICCILNLLSSVVQNLSYLCNLNWISQKISYSGLNFPQKLQAYYFIL